MRMHAPVPVPVRMHVQTRARPARAAASTSSASRSISKPSSAPMAATGTMVAPKRAATRAKSPPSDEGGQKSLYLRGSRTRGGRTRHRAVGGELGADRAWGWDARGCGGAPRGGGWLYGEGAGAPRERG